MALRNLHLLLAEQVAGSIPGLVSDISYHMFTAPTFSVIAVLHTRVSVKTSGGQLL